MSDDLRPSLEIPEYLASRPLSPEAAERRKKRRDRIKTQQQVLIWMDRELLEWFQSLGHWQIHIEAALEDYQDYYFEETGGDPP